MKVNLDFKTGMMAAALIANLAMGYVNFEISKSKLAVISNTTTGTAHEVKELRQEVNKNNLMDAVQHTRITQNEKDVGILLKKIYSSRL